MLEAAREAAEAEALLEATREGKALREAPWAAVEKGDAGRLEAWIADGGNADQRWTCAGRTHNITLLMLACLHGHLDLVRLLLRSGASVAARASNGVTALSSCWPTTPSGPSSRSNRRTSAGS